MKSGWTQPIMLKWKIVTLTPLGLDSLTPLALHSKIFICVIWPLVKISIRGEKTSCHISPSSLEASRRRTKWWHRILTRNSIFTWILSSYQELKYLYSSRIVRELEHSNVHQKKTWPLQPSVATWPSQLIARKYIIKSLWLSTGGFWLQFFGQWVTKTSGWQQKWFVYAFSNHGSQWPSRNIRLQWTSFLLVIEQLGSHEELHKNILMIYSSLKYHLSRVHEIRRLLHRMVKLQD